jgi:radical SAM protein with 4Fe4S-binding SPASM domain
LFFSLDGPKDIHDEIRGKGSYDRLMETIQRLRALKKIYGNLYLNIVTTITPRNAPCAEQFIKDTVRTLKPDAISINLFRYHQPDAPKLPADLLDAYRLAVETYADQIQSGQLSHYRFLGRSILKAKEIVQKELIYRVAKYNEFVTQCTAGTLSYVVMEDGAIKPCEILDDKIGNVYDDDGSFTKHITSKKTRKLRNWIRDTKCRCTYECAMSTNTLFSMPMPLKLMKQMIKPQKKPKL